MLDLPEQSHLPDNAAAVSEILRQKRTAEANFRPRIVVSNDCSADSNHLVAGASDGFSVASPFADKAKRCVDLVFSLLALPVVLIFALPIALLIATNGGNPIYGHLRVGRNGKRFICYKFRTMTVDAETRLQTLLDSDPALLEEWSGHFKLKNDPRVTRLGALLRKTSLDEIPQILNVLKGEMSWVGPRPVIPEELSKYGSSVPAYFACRPGISGLWQINGRSNTTYAERAAFDVHYAKSWSVMLDLKILLLTIPRVLAARGSY